MNAGAGSVCGWSLQGRLLRLETPVGHAPLLAERLFADEAVCRGFELRLEALADPGADVDALLGEELGVHLACAEGRTRAWYGLVVETTWAGPAAQGERWQLCLRPWSVLLEQRVGCALHEDLAADAVLEQLFSAMPRAHWRLALTRPLRPRPLCTQYAETDWALCTRLMAEEGLIWFFEALHGDEAQAASAGGRWRHRLVVADAGAARTEIGPLRFAAEAPTRDGPARHDTVDELAEHHGGGPAFVGLGSWCSREGRHVAAGCESDAAAGPRPEHHDGRGVDRFADRRSAAAAAEGRLRAFELGRQGLHGAGGARELAAGVLFTLHDLPGTAAERRLVVLAVQHEAANALGPALARALGADELEAGRYRNRFDAAPAERPLVAAAPVRPRAPGLQAATVVGVEHGLPMADGALRVKLRFAWQGDADPAGDGVAQAPWPLRRATGRRGGAWVRVAQPLAGPGWGAVFVPRVGAEVLVGHLDGDPDRPVVLGALFNGRDPPPYGGAPLAGIVSACQPPSRGCAGEWVLDDTTGQLRTRLASLPMPAELGLGWLVAQAAGSAVRGAPRGAGFEAATAARASVRAGRGLLLTTHARPARGGSCEGGQMDCGEAGARLDRAQSAAAAWARKAGGQLPSACEGAVRALEALPRPASAGEAAAGRAAAAPDTPDTPDAAWLALAAEASLAAACGGEIVHSAAGDALAMAGAAVAEAAADDAAVVAGASLRLAAAGGALRLAAAQGSAALRAHAGGLELRADGPLRVCADGGELRVAARGRLVLQAAGSAVVLDGADLRLRTPGVLTVAAAAHRFPGPGRVQARWPALPQRRPGAPPNWIEIDHHDAEGRPFAGQRYVIHFEGGSTIEGRLDAAGHARHEQVPERALRVDYEPREPLPAPPWPPLSDLVDALRERLG